MKSLVISLLCVVVLNSCSRTASTENANAEMARQANDITGRYFLPERANPGEGAYLKGELIYSLENPPTPETHASTLVETPSGIVSAFFSGTHEKHPDVGIRVSRLENGQWTWPEEVANGILNDTLRYPCWNPVLFLPQGGPLQLYYKVGPSPREWWGMLITSEDDGKTWSEPIKLGEDEKIGHLSETEVYKSIKLEDGTIIHPSSTDMNAGREYTGRVHFGRLKYQLKKREGVVPCM